MVFKFIVTSSYFSIAASGSGTKSVFIGAKPRARPFNSHKNHIFLAEISLIATEPFPKFLKRKTSSMESIGVVCGTFSNSGNGFPPTRYGRIRRHEIG